MRYFIAFSLLLSITFAQKTNNNIKPDLFPLALGYINLKLYQKAEDQLKKIIQSTDNSLKLRKLAILKLVEVYKIQEKQNLIIPFLQKNLLDDQIKLLLAKLYTPKELYQNVDILKSIKSDNNSSIWQEAQYLYIKTLKENNELSNAIEAFEFLDIQNLEPFYQNIINNLGIEAYTKKNQLDIAQKLLLDNKKQLQDNTSNTLTNQQVHELKKLSQQSQVKIFFQEHKYQQTIDFIKNQQKPLSIFLQHSLLFSYLKVQNTNEIFQLIEKNKLIDPKSYYYLALAYLQKNNLKKALSVIKKAKKIRKDDFQLNFLELHTLLKNNQTKKIPQIIENIDITKLNSIQKNIIAYFNAISQNQKTTLIPILQSILNQYKNITSDEYLLIIAEEITQLYRQQQQHDKIIALWVDLIKDFKINARINLALAHKELKEYNQAINQLNLLKNKPINNYSQKKLIYKNLLSLYEKAQKKEYSKLLNELIHHQKEILFSLINDIFSYYKKQNKEKDFLRLLDKIKKNHSSKIHQNNYALIHAYILEKTERKSSLNAYKQIFKQNFPIHESFSQNFLEYITQKLLDINYTKHAGNIIKNTLSKKNNKNNSLFLQYYLQKQDYINAKIYVEKIPKNTQDQNSTSLLAEYYFFNKNYDKSLLIIESNQNKTGNTIITRARYNYCLSKIFFLQKKYESAVYFSDKVFILFPLTPYTIKALLLSIEINGILGNKKDAMKLKKHLEKIDLISANRLSTLELYKKYDLNE